VEHPHPDSLHARADTKGVGAEFSIQKAMLRLDEVKWCSGATGCAFDTPLFGGEYFHH